MRALLIDPFEKSVKEIRLEDDKPGTLRKAIDADTTCIFRVVDKVIGVGDDLGLYRVGQRYWAFRTGRPSPMLGGKVLLMSHDEAGETVDLNPQITAEMHEGLIHWIGDKDDAERAIRAGSVPRPAVMFNEQEVWRWTPDTEGTKPDWAF